jgi:hypothetical protein
MEDSTMYFIPNLKRLVFFTLIFITAISFQHCVSMDSRDNFQSLDGWNLSPDIIQKGNPEGIKDKNFYYKNYPTPSNLKSVTKEQLEKSCVDIAKKEKSGDLIFDMVTEVTQPNPVIKHKQMTGALLVAKLIDKTSQVKVVECVGDTDKNSCTCALAIEIEGGKESILNLAKEIDNKTPGKK